MNFIVFFVIILIFGFQFNQIECNESTNEPCDYHDTIDLTNSLSYPNGSYLYKNILIPKKLIGFYDYQMVNQSIKIPTELHRRGCICLIKPCIKWCCNSVNEYFNGETCRQNDNISSSLDKLDNLELFVSQWMWRPCISMYHLDMDKYDYDAWELIENGSLRIYHGEKIFSNTEFCLTNIQLNSSQMKIVPFICDESTSNDEFDTERNVLYAYAMICSLPFMFITILIYLIIPELNNLHGKALCCYLIGLFIGYSILSGFMIRSHNHNIHPDCVPFMYVAYFFFMSAFFWLSVISFDIYSNFRGVKRTYPSQQHETKRFLFYGLYCWGLAGIFCLFAWLAQNSELISENYKPGIGQDNNCWFNVDENFSATIYFYGPILLIIIFNIVMFSLTSWKIYVVQRETHCVITTTPDSQKSLNFEKNRFGLFLRLFLVMGVTWTSEIISYFLGKRYDHLFYITDFLNMLQGILIFIFFVLKERIKKLMLKRYKILNRNQCQSRAINSRTSYRTTLTRVTTPTTNEDNRISCEGQMLMKDLQQQQDEY